MTVVVRYASGSSKLFLDVVSVTEIDGGIVIACQCGEEVIPMEAIRDFRMALN